MLVEAWALFARVREKLVKPLEVTLSQLTGEFLRLCETRERGLELEEATQFVVEASRLLRLKVQDLLPQDKAGLEDEQGGAIEAAGFEENEESACAVRDETTERAADVLGKLIARQRGSLARGCSPWPEGLSPLSRRVEVRYLDREEFCRTTSHLVHKLSPLVFNSDRSSWRKLFKELARRLFGVRTVLTFRQFVGSGEDTRRPVAGLLLALELNRRRKIVLEQQRTFGEILMYRRKRLGDGTGHNGFN